MFSKQNTHHNLLVIITTPLFFVLFCTLQYGYAKTTKSYLTKPYFQAVFDENVVQELKKQNNILANYRNHKKTKSIKRLIKATKRKIAQLEHHVSSKVNIEDHVEQLQFSQSISRPPMSNEPLLQEELDENNPIVQPITPSKPPLDVEETKVKKAPVTNALNKGKLTKLKLDWYEIREVIHLKKARLREYQFVGHLLYDIQEIKGELNSATKKMVKLEQSINRLAQQLRQPGIEKTEEYLSAQGSKYTYRYIEQEDKTKGRTKRVAIIREAFWLKIKALKSSLRWFQVGWKSSSELNPSDKAFVKEYQALITKLETISKKLGIKKINVYNI